MGLMGEGEIPSTTVAVVTHAAGGVFGIAHGGAIFEAADPQAWAPVVGDTVLADYLPSARQWVVVGIL